MEKYTIVALGDSLTAGYQLSLEEAFPSQLQKILQPENIMIEIINAGISGNTAQDGLNRIQSIIDFKPKMVILALGANDGLRAYPPEQTYQALAQTIEILQKNNIRVLLAGMKALRNLGPEYTKPFDNIYPRLAKKYNISLMPFFLEDVALKPNMNLADGLHPNAQGVNRMAKNMAPYVKKELQKDGVEF